ncbi:alpha/beta hydrolase [Hymenobacter sp. ASUV-10]|uniref:Alpha/beta hydrolase n=1 Tax=Hymenobacter aranciens TaxID=3063996 RepID=A0ABT9BFX8_9BACT|nr:alpha/beta hydrolase [Hymenobacter sp. ASUV-10]MDO7877173.1 alpha/beta hydrolase [Hymenobacter sp. ASUV-10]
MAPSPDNQPSRFRRLLGAVGRVAALPVRGAGYLVRSGQAHQHFFLPVLNGALGDQLAARHDPRAIQLSFRRAGRDVPVAELALSEPRQKTVVFIHGLMGDELIWQTGFQDGPGSRRYGPRLAEDARVRTLYLRYNTGLHLSENGRALHALLSELVATYPEAIGELVLIGHSMGGLIIRSAGHYASRSYELGIMSYELANVPDSTTHNSKLTTHNSSWLPHLRSVFMLGTPNDGSWLEQNSHFTERLLNRINVFPTRFLSRALNKRSNGIKDLRQAILVDEDWQDAHATDLLPPRTEVPPLPGVAYHVLLGSWLRTTLPTAVREYFGDGLVGTGSARGSVFGAEAKLPSGTTVRSAVFAQQHHGGLLNHPEVYQYLKLHL